LRFKGYNRLKKSPEFKLVQKKGRRAYGRFVNIYRMKVDLPCSDLSGKSYSGGRSDSLSHSESQVLLNSGDIPVSSESVMCGLGLYHSKLGVTVSKKVHKRAVRRNRIKRLIREVFRNTLLDSGSSQYCVSKSSGVHSSKNYVFHYLIIARKHAVGCSGYNEMKNDIEKALSFYNKRERKFSSKARKFKP